MATANVASFGQAQSNPRNGTPLSRAQDDGIDAVVRIDAAIAALQHQREEVVAINRAICAHRKVA